MLLKAELPEGTYLADVGFGNLAPTCALLLEPQIEQEIPHELMRFVTVGGELTLQAQLKYDWAHIYRVIPYPRYDGEYEITNWYSATHPETPYQSNLIVAKPGPNRSRITMYNARVTMHDADGHSEKRWLVSESEFKEVLRGEFGLNLSDQETEDCVAIMKAKGQETLRTRFWLKTASTSATAHSNAFSGEAVGLQRAPKLNQEAIAGRFHHPPVMLANAGFDEVALNFLAEAERPLLIWLYHGGEAHCVSGKDCSEAASGHCGRRSWAAARKAATPTRGPVRTGVGVPPTYPPPHHDTRDALARPRPVFPGTELTAKLEAERGDPVKAQGGRRISDRSGLATLKGA